VWNGQLLMEYLEGRGGYSDRTTYPLPDVVVLDVQLPLVDGFQILQWRRTRSFLTIPFVVLTGYEACMKRCLDLSADRVLLKRAGAAYAKELIQQICEVGRRSRSAFGPASGAQSSSAGLE
jgi:CheY-like chemotaxis protein